MTSKYSLIRSYLRGLSESGEACDIILDAPFDFAAVKKPAPYPATAPRAAVMRKTPTVLREPPKNSFDEIKEHVLPESKNVLETDKRDELAKFYYKCRNCVACHLSKTRKHFVFGAGNAYSDVLVIGEAPGEQEDLQGFPFVGAAGDLLTKMLAAIRLERKDIFIANILKCRPPSNRTPEKPEIASCMPILKKQIEIIKPKVILLLGKTAAQSILKSEKTVGALRGTVHYYGEIPAIVSYHPSALLRDASYKRPAWEDLQKFERLLGEVRRG